MRTKRSALLYNHLFCEHFIVVIHDFIVVPFNFPLGSFIKQFVMSRIFQHKTNGGMFADLIRILHVSQ